MAYEGHAEYSASKAAADENKQVAAADRPDYDPNEFANQPGAAARSKGYPRHDGRSTTIGGTKGARGPGA